MQQLLPTAATNVTTEQLAEGYAWPAEPSARPWIRANFTHSVDASFADANGRSAGVSNESDKRVFRLLRATCDAVLVGAGTASAEDYGPVTVPDDLRHLRDSHPHPTANPLLLVVTNKVRITGRAADSATLLPGGDQLVPNLRALADRGISRVLCEGGPHLFTDLLQAHLVDDICLTTVPILTGSASLRLLTAPVNPPLETKLESLFEDDGTLLARWSVAYP